MTTNINFLFVCSYTRRLTHSRGGQLQSVALMRYWRRSECESLIQTSNLSVVTVVWSYIHRMWSEVDVDFLPGNHIWSENVASWNNQCRRDRYLFKLAIISDGVGAMFILDSFDLELTARSIVVLCILTWKWNFHRNGSCYVLFVYVELTSDGTP